ncbi:MAG TPA: putative sugar O-methyltransferase [Bradyrhizobium sp.]|nr:putative sugar O-methyltransferase [Bradyrhizobium sp.]
MGSALLASGAEEKHCLETARANLREYFFRHEPKRADAGDRWEHFLQGIRSVVPTFATAIEAIRFSQHNDAGFDHRLPAHLWRPLLPLTFDLLNAEFPAYKALINTIADSPFSRPETVIEYDGRRVSNILLYDLRYVLVCISNMGRVGTMCEIGGGNGMPAYTWLSSGDHRPNLYVIIDFPESMFFAETFLRMNFPQLRFHYVQSPDPLESRLNEYDVVFCPILYHDAVRSYPFDLVENTGSLQEMSEEWIDYWMNWLRDGASRYFYSVNYFAQPLDFLAEGTNTWSPRVPQNWHAVHLGADAALIKTQTVRSYADTLAKRSDPPDEKGRRLASARYEATRVRSLSNQVLLEAMDALRINPDEEALYHLLKRCIEDRQEVPKEAQYLCQYLATQASQGFHARHGADLEAIAQSLSRIRSGGREAIY